MVAPKTRPMQASSRVDGRLRNAVVSPPRTAPAPMATMNTAVEPAAAVEGELRQQRQRHGEVEREDADDRHGEERQLQVGRGPDVAQSLAHLALGPHHARPPIQLGCAHHGQRHDHGGVRHGVDEEAGGHAHA